MDYDEQKEEIKKQDEDEFNKDRELFYPTILYRQLGLFFGAVGIIFVVIMAMYAELEEIGEYLFGENGEWVTLVFVIFLIAGGIRLFFYCHDIVDEIKSGKRLKNTYTLIKSTALILATYGMLKFQYINMHFRGGDSHSIFRLVLKLILGYSLE